MKLDYLDIASKLIIIFGALNISFAVVGSVLAHLFFPKGFVFVHDDELFTGISWDSILAASTRLGLWMVLQADATRGMMSGFGILTIFLAWNGLRAGAKWALNAILLSGLVSGVYFWTIASLYFNDGLYNGLSGISLGIWTIVLLYSPWALGLTFGWVGIKRQERFQPPSQTDLNKRIIGSITSES